jgi:hypothetical protein
MHVVSSSASPNPLQTIVCRQPDCPRPVLCKSLNDRKTVGLTTKQSSAHFRNNGDGWFSDMTVVNAITYSYKVTMVSWDIDKMINPIPTGA